MAAPTAPWSSGASEAGDCDRSAWLPGDDRGLLYGDGLFETCAVVGGRLCQWSRHWSRLLRGCERLAIPPPDLARLEPLLAERLAGLERGVLKLIHTRGSGGRGYRPPLAAQPRTLLQRHPWPDYPADWWRSGIELRLCRTPLGVNPLLAGLKHLNRLEQVLARAEWSPAETAAEGLMLDSAGRVIEGTMSNVFFLRAGRLHTPRLEHCGVAGVMRQTLLEQAPELGLTVYEGDFRLSDFLSADAVFMTNALIGFWPVRRLLQRQYAPDALPPALGTWLLEQRDAP